MKERTELDSFGKWFKPFVEMFPQVKKKAIAQRAGISPVSFSRILNEEHGVALATAEGLMRSLNELTGRNAVDIGEGLRIVAGINVAVPSAAKDDDDARKIAALFAGSGLAINFNETDFEWIAQLIEMRSLWKTRQKQMSRASETFVAQEDSFMPSEEVLPELEPAPIRLKDLLTEKSVESKDRRFKRKNGASNK